MKKLFPIKAYILFTIIVMASVVVSYCVCAQAECAKDLLDLALGMNGTKTILIKLIFVTSALLSAELFRKLLTIEYERVITNTLQEKFMKGILSTSFRKFTARNQDTYMSMFNNELRSVISDYYMEMLDFLFSILSVLFYSTFLIRLQPIIAIIIMISNIFPIIVPGLFAHVLQKKKFFYLQAMQKCNIRFGDGIKGWSLLKLHGRGGVYKKIFERAGEEATREKACYQTWNAFCEIVIGFFSYTSYLCIVAGGIWLIYRGSLTAGGLLASITVSEAMVSPVINLAYQANTIQSTRQIRKEILGEYISTEFLEKSEPQKLVLQEPLRRIEIRNLSYAYEKRTILEDLNMTFENGKKYLIRGDNGSGKSTLLKILTKQCEYQGSILVNGMELRDISAESFFAQIGFAMQKPFLFNDTIEHNITLWEEAEKEELANIMKRCQAHNLINNVDMTTVYHDGKSNLSGGETQKIALARLMFDKKKVQIWDEAMSAFDKKSSRMLEESILRDSEITLIHVQHMVNEELVGMYDEVYEL